MNIFPHPSAIPASPNWQARLHDKLGCGYSPGKSSQPTMANRLIESVRNAKDCHGKPAFMPRVSDLADDGCNTVPGITAQCGRIQTRVKGLSLVGNSTGRIIFLHPGNAWVQIRRVQQTSCFVTKTCQSHLETQDQPAQGLLNTCLTCDACGSVPCGSYPYRRKLVRRFSPLLSRSTALRHNSAGTWLAPLRGLLAQAQREGNRIPCVVVKENEQPDRLTMSSAGCGFLSPFEKSLASQSLSSFWGGLGGVSLIFPLSFLLCGAQRIVQRVRSTRPILESRCLRTSRKGLRPHIRPGVATRTGITSKCLALHFNLDMQNNAGATR